MKSNLIQKLITKVGHMSLTTMVVFSAMAASAKTPVVPYTILKSYENSIQIRHYPSAVVAETEMIAGDKNSAFRILAGYIFGKNIDSKNIGMTAPVDMGGKNIGMTAPVDNFDKDGKSYMRFYMPEEYSLQSLPKPLDPRIVIRELPASERAVIEFSGTMSHKNVSKHQAALEQWMTEQGLTALSAPLLSGYDAPWTPWFLRRNEIAFIIK